jgi:hypothetical protein
VIVKVGLFVLPHEPHGGTDVPQSTDHGLHRILGNVVRNNYAALIGVVAANIKSAKAGKCGHGFVGCG